MFTRCEDCGVTLYAIVRTWRRVPAHKQVIWRRRTPDDIFYDVTVNLNRRRLGFDPLGPFRARAFRDDGEGEWQESMPELSPVARSD